MNSHIFTIPKIRFAALSGICFSTLVMPVPRREAMRAFMTHMSPPASTSSQASTAQLQAQAQARMLSTQQSKELRTQEAEKRLFEAMAWPTVGAQLARQDTSSSTSSDTATRDKVAFLQSMAGLDGGW